MSDYPFTPAEKGVYSVRGLLTKDQNGANVLLGLTLEETEKLLQCRRAINGDGEFLGSMQTYLDTDFAERAIDEKLLDCSELEQKHSEAVRFSFGQDAGKVFEKRKSSVSGPTAALLPSTMTRWGRSSRFTRSFSSSCRSPARAHVQAALEEQPRLLL